MLISFNRSFRHRPSCFGTSLRTARCTALLGEVVRGESEGRSASVEQVQVLRADVCEECALGGGRAGGGVCTGSGSCRGVGDRSGTGDGGIGDGDRCVVVGGDTFGSILSDMVTICAMNGLGIGISISINVGIGIGMDIVRGQSCTGGCRHCFQRSSVRRLRQGGVQRGGGGGVRGGVRGGGGAEGWQVVGGVGVRHGRGRADQTLRRRYYKREPHTHTHIR